MPKVINTQIRRDNTNNITYVLKKFDNGTFVLNIYQAQNKCYYLVRQQKGICGNARVVLSNTVYPVNTNTQYVFS